MGGVPPGPPTKITTKTQATKEDTTSSPESKDRKMSVSNKKMKSTDIESDSRRSSPHSISRGTKGSGLRQRGKSFDVDDLSSKNTKSIAPPSRPRIASAGVTPEIRAPGPRRHPIGANAVVLGAVTWRRA